MHHSQVYLYFAELEPSPAAFRQIFGLRNLCKPENTDVEALRRVFPAFRHCQLHVVDFRQHNASSVTSLAQADIANPFKGHLSDLAVKVFNHQPLPLITAAYGHATQAQTLENLCIQDEEVRDPYAMEL